MQQKTVTFRAPGATIKALDSLAALQQRDRSFLLNEAVDHYLAMNEYYREQIAEGMRDIRRGEHVSHAEAQAVAATWSKKAKLRPRKKVSA
jgi:RHH-type rel operon transcriptional repressor/antitoxin RelB